MKTNKILTILLMLFMGQFAMASTWISPNEFTVRFIHYVEQRYPNIKGNLVQDLQVSFEDNSTDNYTSYLDNAYTEYRNNHTALDEVISRYAKSIMGVFESQKLDNKTKDIVPIIKDNMYLKEVEQVFVDKNQTMPLFYDRLNAELLVFYAFDSPSSLTYASKDEIEKLGISKQDIRGLAIKNLKARLPQIKITKDDTLSIISVDHNFESSLLLFDEIWDKKRFGIKDNIVVFVPTRDLLVVTGSEDIKGIKRARNIIHNNRWAHMVSSEAFVRIDHHWKLLK